jgi:hypothetical protein
MGLYYIINECTWGRFSRIVALIVVSEKEIKRIYRLVVSPGAFCVPLLLLASSVTDLIIRKRNNLSDTYLLFNDSKLEQSLHNTIITHYTL